MGFDQNKPLFIDHGKKIVAGDLLENSKTLAIALFKKGVKKGDRVVIAVAPGAQFLEIIYANMMLQTVMALIDPQMGRENYLAKLSQFNPHHAFVDSRLVFLNEHPIAKFIILKLKKTIPSFPLMKGVTLFTTGFWLPIFQKHFPIQKLYRTKEISIEFLEDDANEEFLITYTSGTLSEPKGVVHTYQSISNSVKHLSQLIAAGENRIMATHLPQFVLLGIHSGLLVHTWDENLSEKAKLDFIKKHSITTLFGPPSDFYSLVKYLKLHNIRFPKTLKNIFLGSAPVYTSFLSDLLMYCEDIKVTCLYGMTENLMVAYIDGQEKIEAESSGDLVGKPFPGVSVQIGADGEIKLFSDQLFKGYYGQENVEEYHLTGDLGTIDDKGRIVLFGRKKDMIIRKNFNIYPGLYEPTIHKIKGVSVAAMVGIYNAEKADEEIILAIENDASLETGQVLSMLKSGPYSIDKEALPDKIILTSIPRSGRQNKVDKKALTAKIKKMLS